MYLRASSVERVSLCSGSLAADSRARHAGADDETKAAMQGTLDHATVAGLLEERFLAHRPLLASHDDVEWDVRFAIRTIAEQMCAYDHLPESGAIEQKLYSATTPVGGSPDFWMYYPELHIVEAFDWKMGWVGNMTLARGNLQLRAYAVLIHEAVDDPEATVFFHLVVPNRSAKRERVTSVRYTPASIAKARIQLEGIAHRARVKTAKRCPSTKACEWCRANGTAFCPESIEYVKETNALMRASADVMPTVTNADLGLLLGRIAQVEKAKKAIQAEMIARLRAGADPAECGYMLQEGKGARKITDAPAALERMSALGGTLREWLEACTVSRGNLLKRYKRVTGAKGVTAEENLSVLLKGLEARGNDTTKLVPITI